MEYAELAERRRDGGVKERKGRVSERGETLIALM